MARDNTEAIRLLDAWYSTPDNKPSGYWDELVALIEGHPLMLVTKNVHVVIELDEEETAILRYLLTAISDKVPYQTDKNIDRFVTDLRFKLPSGT